MELPSRKKSLRPRLAICLTLAVSIAVVGCIPSAIDTPASITYDGQTYQFQRPGRYLTLQESDLTEIGEASRINHPYVEDTTVYAIQGIDPASAIAMRSARGAADDLGPMGELIVLYVDDYPHALCPFEKEDVAQPAEDC